MASRLPCLQFMAAVLAILATCTEATDASPYVKVLWGSGSYGTLSSLCFLASALFDDLLLLRTCLVFANMFLLLQIFFGFPDITNWGMAPNPILAVGSVAINSTALILHVWALGVLLWDERPIKMDSPTEEAVWRCFFRRSGMARREARIMYRLGTVKQYHKGEMIFDGQLGTADLHLTFVISGQASAVQSSGATQYVRSGGIIGLSLLNLFGVYIGLEGSDAVRIVADMPTTVLSWDVPTVLLIAKGAASIALPSHWRSFALFCVASEFCCNVVGKRGFSSKGELEDDSWYEGAMCKDLAEPLTPEELAEMSTSFWGYLCWIGRSLKPFPPIGLRHRAEPLSGAMARTRMLVAQAMASTNHVVPEALQEQVTRDLTRGRLGSPATMLPMPSAELLLKTPPSNPAPPTIVGGTAPKMVVVVELGSGAPGSAHAASPSHQLSSP